MFVPMCNTPTFISKELYLVSYIQLLWTTVKKLTTYIIVIAYCYELVLMVYINYQHLIFIIGRWSSLMNMLFIAVKQMMMMTMMMMKQESISFQCLNCVCVHARACACVCVHACVCIHVIRRCVHMGIWKSQKQPGSAGTALHLRVLSCVCMLLTLAPSYRFIISSFNHYLVSD